MKETNDYRVSLISFIFMSAIMLCSRQANADFTFGEPTNLGSNINTSSNDGLVSIAPDGLSLYFTSDRPGGRGNHDLYVATRISTEDDWGQPTNLGEIVNWPAEEYFSCISSNGLELYLDSNRWGSLGARDLWVTTRSSIDAPWPFAANLGSNINTASDDVSPNLSADGLTLLFSSNRPGGRGDYDLYICTRSSLDASWSTPVNLGEPINSAYLDVGPSLSSDGQILFFHSIRPTGFGSYDLYYSKRQTLDTTWSEPVNLGQTVNSSYVELGPSVSSDGRTLYFSEHPNYPARPEGFGGSDLWQTQILPIVDFNGDKLIDIDDLVIMIENWGTNESLCDIGPMPWGDGIVDKKDLQVLMSHWGEDYTLMAHWKLDETEGDIAHDSIGENDGTIYGTPLWQPTGGYIDGALEFDGINDYISTPRVLELSPGPFSIFAWIKGGLPGQVILSQANRADWLAADATDGSLKTELTFLGKAKQTLQSQAVITDDNWHRLGLVWDGTNRILYVDDTEVASDTYGAGSLVGNLQIGTGNKLGAGTFFSGLIDDVRIYERAVTP